MAAPMALVVLAVVFLATLAHGFRPYTELINRGLSKPAPKFDFSPPLHLTPYIREGKLAEGRKLAEVRSLPGNEKIQLKSYSGYLTVNDKHDSNMFFWFFPALSGKKNTPILLWLQGGPGASSLYGLFSENGPIEVTDSEGSWHIRNYTWNKEFAVLFIDNPVGTGFSYTGKDEGYARNEVDVGRDLYEALKQFFTLFEEYRGKPFFVTGESYAGKYVPAIAHKIFTMGNDAKKAGISLAGLSIGNGLCDPRNMFDYGDYLYQIGLIDELQREYFKKQEELAVKYIDAKQFDKAFDVFDYLLNGDLINGSSYFKNATGLSFYFNFIADAEAPSYFDKFLTKPETREAIHVGNLPFNDGSVVEKHLKSDVMDSVKPWIQDLLNANYPILFYNGQLDIIVAAPLTESFLKNLKWKGSERYLSAPRYIYRLKPEANVAGYVRHVDSLYQVIVRKAGHMVPTDQPEVALDMITKFVNQNL